MNDAEGRYEDLDDDLRDLVALLLGGRLTDTLRDPRLRNIMAGSPGVLRRLVEHYPGDPTGVRQQITPIDAVSALTVPAAANSALISIETTSARYSSDGTNPTAAVGLLLPAGTLLRLTGQATLTAARFIGTVAGGSLDVEYFT